jgi:T-complex protein 1 subunit theta
MSDDSPALRSGLHPAEIIEGYEKALGKALTWLEEMVIPGSETLDIRNKVEVAKRIKVGPHLATPLTAPA